MKAGEIAFVITLGLYATIVPTVAAQPVAPLTQAEPLDPARMAAAGQVVDRIWPLGTYRRMMDGTMSKMMDQMMTSMFNMRAADIVGATDKEAGSRAGDATMGEVATKADPNFRERMRIMTDVMFRELIPLFERVEPTVRQSLVRIYARRFTADQLGEMSRFFSTPAGKAYAEQSMLVFVEPEMLNAMQAFGPEMVKAMPTIMKKVEAATSHLPPPPKRDETQPQ